MGFKVGNKFGTKANHTERTDFPPFPKLPTVAELTPARVNALTMRMRHAQRNAKAFEAEGLTYAAAYYRKGAADIAVLLAEAKRKAA